MFAINCCGLSRLLCFSISPKMCHNLHWIYERMTCTPCVSGGGYPNSSSELIVQFIEIICTIKRRLRYFLPSQFQLHAMGILIKYACEEQKLSLLSKSIKQQQHHWEQKKLETKINKLAPQKIIDRVCIFCFDCGSWFVVILCNVCAYKSPNVCVRVPAPLHCERCSSSFFFHPHHHHHDHRFDRVAKSSSEIGFIG